MNKRQISCIIVLYNMNYKDSYTFKYLLECPEYKQGIIDIVAVDNSVRSYHNSDVDNLERVIYVSMNGNKGLSKAYNAGLDAIEKNYGLDNRMIVILDDDTEMGKDYFKEVIKASGDAIHSIFLPIVKDQTGYLSPSFMFKYKCKRCYDLDDITDENICGINSGMAIKGELFKNYRYNEDMFLDYIDHNFLRDMKRKHIGIRVLDVELHQNFSSDTDTYKQAKHRLKIFKKDIRVYYSHGFMEYMTYCYVMVRRKLSLLRKYKRIGIFFI